ncbi:DUF4158 domain-containing protein [Amycolatopsis sp. cmx-4-68]|uniref:DUF4158 domain-containing protein n=1 Tax=Amycolatopsis sp. cmx-4-68 TaxID=2790938 RepID=UPI00397E5AE8
MATQDVFSAEELARLRGFPEINRAELIRYFTLTGADEAFVRQFRTGRLMLGVVVQLCSLPWLGFVPDEPGAAPTAVPLSTPDMHLLVFQLILLACPRPAGCSPSWMSPAMTVKSPATAASAVRAAWGRVRRPGPRRACGPRQSAMTALYPWVIAARASLAAASPAPMIKIVILRRWCIRRR